MVSCVACSLSQTKNTKVKGITFHHFPKKEERKKCWVSFIDKPNWTASKHSFLCSLHFADDCFDRSSSAKIRLKDCAVPTINITRIKYTWQDMKGSAKKRNAFMKNHMRATGGGPPVDTDLNDQGKKIIDIMGIIVTEGDTTILESDCNFSFATCEETEMVMDHDYITQTQKAKITELLNNTSTKLDISLEDSNNCETANSVSMTNTNGKKQDISLGGTNNCETANNFTVANKNGKTPVRVQRLNNALSANNKLVELTETQANQRDKYNSTKLELYKRDVEAKERIVVALENLLLFFTNKNENSFY